MTPRFNRFVSVLSLAAAISFQAAADPGQPGSSEGAFVYSNDVFVELVKKYASSDGSSVDYALWKDTPEDLAALDRQVELLARVSPVNQPEQFPTRTSQRSYWINTYNTLVLQAVLELWPLESVREVKVSVSSRVVPGKGFFYDRKFVVGAEETNLYDLEKEVLRQQKDPRLHFALNCASGSCPVLRPWDWTDEQLDDAAREFINDANNVWVEQDRVYLSRIFKWYKKDFPKDLLAYLQQYADSELAENLQTARDQRYQRRYRSYDWSLNTNDGEGISDGH